MDMAIAIDIDTDIGKLDIVVDFYTHIVIVTETDFDIDMNHYRRVDHAGPKPLLQR